MNSHINSSLYKRACAYIIDLTAAVINDTAPAEKPDDVDWETVIKIAESHSVLNIVSYAAEKLINKPDEKHMRFLREYCMQKIVVEAEQEIEAMDAMDKLEQMHIKHMPLKGIVIKQLYPSPDMRTMGDIDILIEHDKCDDVIKAFCSDGFIFCDEGDLHSNVRRGNAYIEFHKAMIDEDHARLSSYFGSGFERAVKEDGYEYRYALSREDMYIFLIAHIAKHYRYGGTGIRTLLDLYVYRKVYTDLDSEYIAAETEKTGLGVFRQKMEALADEWYSGGFDGSFNNIAEYIISGGVYGTKDTRFQNSFIFENITENSVRDSKSKYIRDILFPSFDVLAIRYPDLKKHRWLFPWYWFKRIIDTLRIEPKNIKGRIIDSANVIKIDKNDIDVQREAGIEEL